MGAPVAEAARALARGRLVVYPTDTLLGLGARAADARAVARLEAVKGRSGQPLSIAVSGYDDLDAVAELTPNGRRWVRAHLPGPFTILARPRKAVEGWPAAVVPPGGAIGVRIPDHPVARELARRSGPLVATSANPHGQPPCRDARAARRAFGRRVEVYLAIGPAPSGRPSTFVDLRGDQPMVVPRG
jgi:L-threonylcarbamoyladenylate synthase